MNDIHFYDLRSIDQAETYFNNSFKEDFFGIWSMDNQTCSRDVCFDPICEEDDKKFVHLVINVNYRGQSVVETDQYIMCYTFYEFQTKVLEITGTLYSIAREMWLEHEMPD